MNIRKIINVSIITLLLFSSGFKIGNIFAEVLTKTITVRYFFPRDGKQNPDKTVPNWYYYWKQLVPSSVSRVYNSANTSPEGWAASWYINFQTGVETITIYDIMKTDINYCTSKMLHENKHHDDFYNVVWGGTSYNASKDLDSDGLNDTWEIENGFNPNVNDWNTFNSTWFDPRAYQIEQAAYAADAYASKDWAFPGKQYHN